MSSGEIKCPWCESENVDDCGKDYACRDCGTVIAKPAANQKEEA